MQLVRITAPVSQPVTVEEAKLWGKFGDAEDDTIAGLIRQATEKLDGDKGILNPKRCLVEQTWELQDDAFPSEGGIILPLVPVTTIVSVKYLDADGAEQTMSSDDYALVGGDDAAELVLAAEASWPDIGTSNGPVVKVRFKAGYASLPAQLVGDVLTFVQFWYDNREKRGQIPPGWSSRYRRAVFA